MITGILSGLGVILAPCVGFVTVGTIGLDIALGADIALILIAIAMYINHNDRMSNIC
ncbi:hypothetical protein Xen7305DRAFT_00040050 [Xenococcus sp. PCC 7305]|uniref:hypothetical protein n=1 Tax=Xenococcus sp. PCC 7305 TaxID=102125 RepID=UPI0002AC5060|nr:hypothetical protein [Xenococcus sp. PCC 7305]ELS04277.1 hypothetical protein Xen7305DRAFT_00040050 [Xenococcus sp. PCC 7305]